MHLDFSAAFNRVSHSGLLFKLKFIGLGGSALSICTEFLPNPRQNVAVDGATGECHREVCWVLFCSSYISVKCLSWRRTDYMPKQMTPHSAGLQLFASQKTDLLLLPPLPGTWIGFRSGAITGT